VIVVAAVIEEDGRFFVTRRQAGVHLAGMWEFPGGKIDPHEAHADALRREIREELDADVNVGELVFQTVHAYDDRTIALYFYRCAMRGTPRPLLGQEMRWVAREELPSLGFPPADKELIEILTGRPTSGGS
jgi:8-oxo-dGTP diphosphatase